VEKDRLTRPRVLLSQDSSGGGWGGLSRGLEGDALALSQTPAVALRGLLIICSSLHIPYQTLFFAKLFEPPHHLLNRFARSRLHLEHKKNTPLRQPVLKGLPAIRMAD